MPRARTVSFYMRPVTYAVDRSVGHARTPRSTVDHT